MAKAIVPIKMRDILNFQDYFFGNIIQFGRSNYCLIQNSSNFIHYLTRYGHFKFDIKRFCAFTLLFCVKIDFMANYFVFLSTLS